MHARSLSKHTSSITPFLVYLETVLWSIFLLFFCNHLDYPISLKMWVNEILTEDTSRQRATMNGTISQLHKGEGTNKTSDQRPVVLLNSLYQLLNFVISELLKKMWNQLTS